ncbi:MAG: D-alanyl-D-alanine carboxypeptidase family protein [Lachnospiraceae bacterium]
MRFIITFFLLIGVLFQNSITTYGMEVNSESSIVMEVTTGEIVFEQNSTQRLSPASITKIMTLLLIFESIEEGKISLDDQVVTSAYAKSMGGSQVFLEEGEMQTVDTLIKCIAVASGNDASVAMAEYIAGSESAFVELMNQKATKLGLQDTNFEDCCGLTNSDNHYTSAKDVAIISRELVLNYPQIYNYTGIWMEDITHVTKSGSSVFTLSSTNKLLKQYEYATGLKTGSTQKAKYCLAATARKNNMDLIAVVMAAPDYKVRFSEAITLLEYGFNNCSLYEDKNRNPLADITIKKGVKDTLSVAYETSFSYLDTSGNNVDLITKEMKISEQIIAPIEVGDTVGEIAYYLNGNKIGTVDIVSLESVEKATYFDYLKKIGAAFVF